MRENLSELKYDKVMNECKVLYMCHYTLSIKKPLLFKKPVLITRNPPEEN
jgi:hypothetical protein